MSLRGDPPGMMPEGSVSRALVSELAVWLRQTAAIVGGIGIIGTPIWWLANDAVTAWLELPEKVARIERRLGEEPSVPFVEFWPASQMFPERVRPGQPVRVVYTLRRNDVCDTTVERRFQPVDGVSFVPGLSFRERSAQAPVTLGFEVFAVRFRIPPEIEPGVYAYRPVLYCTGRDPVVAPATFFEVARSAILPKSGKAVIRLAL